MNEWLVLLDIHTDTMLDPANSLGPLLSLQCNIGVIIGSKHLRGMLWSSGDPRC